MKKEDMIKWVATTVTLFGALFVTFDIQPASVFFLNIGAGLFILWGWLIKEKCIIVVNTGMLIIYTIGVIIRL